MSGLTVSGEGMSGEGMSGEGMSGEGLANLQSDCHILMNLNGL